MFVSFARVFALSFLVLSQLALADQFVPTPAPVVGAKPAEAVKLSVPAASEAPRAADASTRIPFFKLDESKLSNLQNQIYGFLREGTAVPFEMVSSAWIEKHLGEFNQQHQLALSVGFFRAMLSLVGQGQIPQDPHALKEHFDGNLATCLHDKQSLAYNLEFSNPLDLFTQNRGQCASGSIAYSMFAREVWGAKGYLEHQPLMVFMKGHMLPAFPLKDEKSELLLVGVEMTTEGPSRRVLGKMDRLEDGEAMEVVDAALYPLLEIFDGALSEVDAVRFADFLKRETAQRYGYSLVKLEAKVQAVRDSTPADGGGSSPSTTGKSKTRLSFGRPASPPGDLKRSRFEQTLGNTAVATGVESPTSVAPLLEGEELVFSVRAEAVDVGLEATRALSDLDRMSAERVELEKIISRRILKIKSSNEKTVLYLLQAARNEYYEKGLNVPLEKVLSYCEGVAEDQILVDYLYRYQGLIMDYKDKTAKSPVPK